MALKTTIAAALAAITLSLFAGAPAEAKTKVYLGVGGAGWGVRLLVTLAETLAA